ncbi:hypothetical protein M3Y99_01396100 [Aphelenchoides fujianensis]|nr:hypothetical protein M3Y99_01396100 [Aphelenchoides fujianensis]
MGSRFYEPQQRLQWFRMDTSKAKCSKADPEAAALMAELRIPPKAPNTLSVEPLGRAQVTTNCFKVAFTATDVHKYEAKFMMDFGHSKGPKNLAEGLQNDVSVERRRVLLNALFRQLISGHPEIFGTEKEWFKLLFDCGQTIIATERLSLPQELIKITLNADLLDPKYRDYLPRRLIELYVELKFVETIRVDSGRLSMDELDADCTSLSIIEMVFHQKVVKDDKFHVFKQQCYLKNPPTGRELRAIQGRVLKEGLAKGVRLCGEDKAAPHLMLQATVKTSAFYPSMSLKKYLMAAFNEPDLHALARLLRDDGQKFQQAATDVKRLLLVSFDRETPAEDGTVLKKQKVMVVDYMKEKYGRERNECDRMPAVIQKTRDRGGNKVVNYFPIDFLDVIDGQRVPLQKMDGKFQQAMIREARMDAPAMQEATKRLANAAFLTASSPYARRFGLGMQTKPIETTADVLHPPAIVFGQGVTVEPQADGQWRLQRPQQDRRFLDGAKVER